MEDIIKPFEFRQCVSILKSTGEKAKDLRKLKDLIASVSDESIFHHNGSFYRNLNLLWPRDFLQRRQLLF